MKLGRVRVMALFMMTAATAAADSANVLHQPTGKWTVEYGKDQCLLSRAYGTDTKPLILTFERLPLSSKVGVYVLRKGASRDRRDGDAVVNAGAKSDAEARYSAYTPTKTGLRLVDVEVNAELLDAAEQAGSIHVQVPREVDESFAVPRLEPAVRALDDCVLDLGRLWGFSIEQQKLMKQASEPAVPLEELFDSADYPWKAMINEEMGRAKVLLPIDKLGRPMSCTLTRSTGSKTLDEATCMLLMKRASFHPAIDQDGQPMQGLYVTSVLWLIEG
jgi:TonB family protein